MNIVILGAGQVGSELSAILASDHDVTLIDLKQEKLMKISDHHDLKTICGNACYPKTLEQAEIEKADLAIAMTQYDEVNMVACQVAHSLFQTRYKIARVHSPHYHVRGDLYGDADLPIDVFINPERLLSRAIKELVRFPGANEVVSLLDKTVNVCAIDVPKDFNHKEDRSFPDVGQLYIDRSGQWECMDPDLLAAGQSIILVTFSDHTQAWLDAIIGSQGEISRIMVMGANKVTEQLIKRLDDSYSVKVVEKDKEKAESLALESERADVLNGDPADGWFLEQEGISETDVFIALTEDDEDNLIACLQAKSMGAARTFAVIKRLNYTTGFAQGLIDNILSPQHIITNQVISSLYQGDLTKTRSFLKGKATIATWQLSEGSQWQGRTVRDIELIGGVSVLAVSQGDVTHFYMDDLVLSTDMTLILLVGYKNVMRVLSRIGKRIK